jgi:hypothetical protein
LSPGNRLIIRTSPAIAQIIPAVILIFFMFLLFSECKPEYISEYNYY